MGIDLKTTLASGEVLFNSSGTTADGLAMAVAPAPTGVAATDTAAVQAALNALPATGGRVVLHSNVGGVAYNFGTTGVTVPPLCQLVGQGMRATRIDYSGTGYAVSVGNQTLGTALAYGCAVTDLAIVMSVNGASGITLRETAAALVANVYIEGVVTTNTSTGVFVDGGNTSNLFTRLDNVVCNHIKTSHRWGTSGTTVSTSITAVNCTAFADTAAGSVGLTVDAACGKGSRWFGGNIEECATGMSVSGVSVFVYGCRFEANTSDVTLGSGAKGNQWFGGSGLASVTDSSGNSTNGFWAGNSDEDAGTPRANTVTGATTFLDGTTMTSATLSTFLTAASGAFGTNPATTGVVRLSNGGAIVSRNQANNANVTMFSLDANNEIAVGAPISMGGFDIHLGTGTGTKIGTATTQKLGFFNAAPVVQPSAYTQTYATADKTLSAYTADSESVAYTGAADGEAKLADLNALRVAYENLRAFVEDIAGVVNAHTDDLQALGLVA